jgi:hypothetical protein
VSSHESDGPKFMIRCAASVAQRNWRVEPVKWCYLYCGSRCVSSRIESEAGFTVSEKSFSVDSGTGSCVFFIMKLSLVEPLLE